MIKNETNKWEHAVFWEVPIDFGSECPDTEDNVVLTDGGDRFEFMKAWWSSVLLKCMPILSEFYYTKYFIKQVSPLSPQLILRWKVQKRTIFLLLYKKSSWRQSSGTRWIVMRKQSSLANNCLSITAHVFPVIIAFNTASYLHKGASGYSNFHRGLFGNVQAHHLALILLGCQSWS